MGGTIITMASVNDDELNRVVKPWVDFYGFDTKCNDTTTDVMFDDSDAYNLWIGTTINSGNTVWVDSSAVIDHTFIQQVDTVDDSQNDGSYGYLRFLRRADLGPKYNCKIEVSNEAENTGSDTILEAPAKYSENPHTFYLANEKYDNGLTI